MAVYVDPIREHPPFHDGNTLWCHMIADTEEELHAMAERIGMRREWYQGDHYDLRPAGRALALQYGAQEMSMRAMARRVCGERKARRRTST
jgi:hypothetical protein